MRSEAISGVFSHREAKPVPTKLVFILFAVLAAGCTAGAQAHEGRGVASEPDRPSNHPAIARIAAEATNALRQGDHEGAVRSFEKLVEMAPKVAEFHANLGMSYYSAGRYLDAVRASKEALRLKASLAHARYFLGMGLAASGQCNEALSYLEQDYPRVADPNLKRGMGIEVVHCARVVNQPNKAVDFVRLLNEDFPDDPDVLYLSSHLYSDLSTRASQRLLVTAPGSYQAHQLNAEVLEIQGRYAEAAAAYRKVLSLNPRLQGIHFRLGRLLLAGLRDSTRLEAARREFEEELKINPSSAAAEYELGEMARRAGQWDEAIERFMRATNLDPGFVDPLIGLGKGLVSAGRTEEAVAPLEAAVKLDPRNGVAHYQLAFAYRRLGREREAEKELAAYRETHSQTLQTMRIIRGELIGLKTEPQIAEPPE